MAKILDMPKLSPTMEEGVLSAWHKKEGDSIGVDDLLAEVETDKATMEFRAFDRGTLLKILVQPGTQVKLGQAVAIVGNAGEDISQLTAQAGGGGGTLGASSPANAQTPADVASAPVGAKVNASSDANANAGAAQPAGSTKQGTFQANAAASPAIPTRKKTDADLLSRTEEAAPDPTALQNQNGGRVFASPYVRKTARDRGIDLHGAQGSGPGGRVVVEDLDQIATRSIVKAPSAPMVHGPQLAAPEVRPLSMMRKTIARRLSESKQTIPHFYLTIDVDAGKLSDFRDYLNREFAEAKGVSTEEGKPFKVSLNDLLIKACAVGLTRVPECNAQFTPDAILVHKRVDISVAVAVSEGLVTPVVRDADRKSIVAIAREVRELAGRARAKKLKPEEMLDGTFSISNLGMFGIDEFSAVVNPPEGAILAVGQVRDEPVVTDGQVVAGKKLAMTLSCDHRVIDGAVGASFLAELRRLLEHPMRILTG